MVVPSFPPAPPAASPMGPPMGGPPMAPPMNPMMGMPPPMLGLQDPMMGLLADPMTMMALLQLIIEADQQQNGPTYPKWYKPENYPKPKANQVIHKANQDKNLYQTLIQRFSDDRRWLQQKVVGVFEGYDEDVEEKFHDASLVLDRQLVVSLLAGADVIPKVTAPKREMDNDAEKIENYLRFCRDEAARRHHRTHSAILAMDEIKSATDYGHIVSRILPNFEAESDECPVDIDLLDPATCFPTWGGGRGIETMTRIYMQTIDEIIGTCERDDNKIGRKLLSKPWRKYDGSERKRTGDDELEVIEYWDRRWKVIAVDGQIIDTWEHKFGFVPFVYVRSPLGDASQVSDPISGGTASTSKKQAELAAKGLSHIAYMKKTHEQKEAIFGAMMTELKKVRNPPRTFAQDMSIYGDAPLVTNAEGGIGMIRLGYEQEVPHQLAQGFSLAPPVLAAINEASIKGMMPRESYGSVTNSQQSGTAIEGLNESGRDKLTPFLVMMEQYHREVDEMILTYIKDWGHLFGSDDQRGTMYVDMPNVGPDEDRQQEITPAMLRQGRMRVQVKMTSLRLQNLGMLGQAIQMWRSMGMMTKDDALEKMGIQNVQAYKRQLEVEEFMQMPEFKAARLVAWMEAEGYSFEEINIARNLVNAQGQTQGTPMIRTGGVMPQGGGQPGIPGMAQAFGAPTGTQGGAPGGMNGPNMGQGQGLPVSPGGLPPGAM